MSTTTVHQQVRQEIFYYLLGGTALLFFILLGGLAVWYGVPAAPSNRVTIGNVADFPPRETPYYISEYGVFVVNVNGRLSVLEPFVPNPYWREGELGGRHCQIQWNDAVGQFQEPCSGEKFLLDGNVIEPALGSATRDMDYYAVEIREDGRIIINFDEVILSEPHAE